MPLPSAWSDSRHLLGQDRVLGELLEHEHEEVVRLGREQA